ncbi:MAG: Gfo/Idh/MocA family oxidoreductase, partial [Phycisphaerales bacterium]|nr:Gfo/Idh/MocA family oxidoreductase [Phycisphaerales bacterium]
MPQENHHHGQRLRAGIIGCGAIGSLLDEDDLTLALSHAGACAATPGVELTAICDTSEERLQRCGDVRQVQQQYVSFQEMLGSEKLDLVSICTPVSQRLEIIEAAVNAQVKVIICEKPLASSTSEGQAIAELINGSQTELVLNFQRRWDAGIQEAAQLVRSGEIGDIHRGFAIYEKGLAHNGSHLIDLMNLLLGPPSGLRAIPDSTMQPADQATPTFDAEFRYDNNDRTALVYVSSLDHSRYSIFELQLLGTLGRIVLSNGGQDVTVYKVVE